MSEESIYHQHKPASGGDYLKIKDGEKVKLRIASEPAISVYKQGDKPRYSWVVFNRDLGIAQVYTGGVSIYNSIADMTDEWGDPSTFDITIKRTGSTMQDTSYLVSPVKTSKDLAENELDLVAKVDLITAIKGKWLRDYVEDNVLPEPITGPVVSADNPPTDDPPTDDDAPTSDINPDEVFPD